MCSSLLQSCDHEAIVMRLQCSCQCVAHNRAEGRDARDWHDIRPLHRRTQNRFQIAVLIGAEQQTILSPTSICCLASFLPLCGVHYFRLLSSCTRRHVRAASTTPAAEASPTCACSQASAICPGVQSCRAATALTFSTISRFCRKSKYDKNEPTITGSCEAVPCRMAWEVSHDVALHEHCSKQAIISAKRQGSDAPYLGEVLLRETWHPANTWQSPGNEVSIRFIRCDSQASMKLHRLQPNET